MQRTTSPCSSGGSYSAHCCCGECVPPSLDGWAEPSSRRDGWSLCSGKLFHTRGCCARPCARTGLPRLHSHFSMCVRRATADPNAACVDVWSQGHATWRAWEMRGELWSSGERSGGIGRALAGRKSEPRTLCRCRPISVCMGKCLARVFRCVCSL